MKGWPSGAGRGRSLVVTFGLLALVSAGCGTQMDRADIARAAGDRGQVASSPPESAAAALSGTPGLGEPAAGTESPARAIPEATPSPTISSTGASVKSNTSTGGVSPAPRAGTPAAAGGSTASPAPGTAQGAAAPTGGQVARGQTPRAPGERAPGIPEPATPAKKAPIRFGSVSSISGATAAAEMPTVEGVQLWVRAVNAAGGLDGHPVEYIVVDDNADPNRHRALVQDLVENNGVVGFVGMAATLSGHASVDYLTKKRVPVIGGEGGSPWFYHSPMYFPLTHQGRATLRSGLGLAAEHARKTGKKKFGLITCTEATVCSEADRIMGGDEARKMGLEPVYKARVSLAQPDYTAECLGARNAGVEIFEVIIDGFSIFRLGDSCARQGYHPIYATVSTNGLDRMKNSPPLDGLILSAPTAPYVLDTIPGLAEFQQAVKSYGKNMRYFGAATPQGWAAGKLLEKVVRNSPDVLTSQLILDGLWSLENEELGGLVYPLTYTRDQNAPEVSCWWPMQISTGAWTAPNATRRSCI